MQTAWGSLTALTARYGGHRDRLCDGGIVLLTAVVPCLQTDALTATGLVRSYPAAAAIAVGSAATFVLRRRIPELCLFAGLASSFASDVRTSLFAAAYAVARYGGRLRFVLVTLAAAVYLSTRHPLGMAGGTEQALYYAVVAEVAFPAVFGGLIRHHKSVRELLRERLEMSGAAVDGAARFALLEERTRLAFNIHDHIGHQATFLALRASELERAPNLPEGVHAHALALRESAQQVMADLRRMLEVLRQGDAWQAAAFCPSNGAQFLAGLVRNMTAVGMVAEYRQHGPVRVLPTRTEQLIYHVIREAFTNTAKYAPGATVLAELFFEENRVVLEVRNGPPFRAMSLRSSGGMGLTGLRLRVAETGGQLIAGPLRDGGFRVWAVLPTPPDDISPTDPSLLPQET